MGVVLGIDAAWTLRQPSGLALVAPDRGGFQLIAAEPSYEHFLARAVGEGRMPLRPTGTRPDIAALLAAAATLAGRSVDLVTVDMPMARSRIERRREADNAVSRHYGVRKCGTHTPSNLRPGAVSDELRRGFGAVGYPLQTSSFEGRGLIEVYPHPALVELARAKERLPYKVAKIRKYWPELSLADRREKLFKKWQTIVGLLDARIDGVAAILGTPGPSNWELKAHEDRIDAVVCAWVGICVLEGKAVCFGDEDAAIWIPSPLGDADAAPQSGASM